ncbi:MAG: hypothetical protein L0216_11190 [Planctomycetales bacterium]|nr:hypothetical protein [Planctomycetales bacterium]
MSTNYFHQILRGYNPTPSPGAEALVGWKSTADGNAILAYIGGGATIPVQVVTPDLTLIRSDKDVNFTGSLSQGASATANLTGLPANSGRIESVSILSDQNLAWEIALFTKDTFTNADLDLDTYLASVRFAEGDGLQMDAVGAWRYDAHGLWLPYRDQDATSELHVALVNRSSTAKSAGSSGEIVVVFGFRADD